MEKELAFKSAATPLKKGDKIKAYVLEGITKIFAKINQFPLQNSAKIIRTSVFGIDDNHKIRNKFTFPANNLNITSIDIQSVEPVDQRTRDALQKSVQLAIEITTNSQEATARYGSLA